MQAIAELFDETQRAGLIDSPPERKRRPKAPFVVSADAIARSPQWRDRR